MKRMEMKVTGWAEDPVAVAQAAIDAATGAGLEAGTGSLSFGNAQGVAVSPEEVEAPPEVEQAPEVAEQAAELAVNFASYKSARLADELNLPASAFDGLVPSGVRGFSVGDVRALADELNEQAAAVAMYESFAVSFASPKSAMLANVLNVPASAFDGVEPSGVRGFTMADVQALAAG